MFLVFYCNGCIFTRQFLPLAYIFIPHRIFFHSSRLCLSNLPSRHHVMQRPVSSVAWGRRRGYSSDATGNKSFVMNSFLGKMETAELFPFPEGAWNKLGPLPPLSLSLSLSHTHTHTHTTHTIILIHLHKHYIIFSQTVLTEEQKQNVGMFVDPVTKFFEVSATYWIADITLNGK